MPGPRRKRAFDDGPHVLERQILRSVALDAVAGARALPRQRAPGGLATGRVDRAVVHARRLSAERRSRSSTDERRGGEEKGRSQARYHRRTIRRATSPEPTSAHFVASCIQLAPSDQAIRGI